MYNEEIDKQITARIQDELKTTPRRRLLGDSPPGTMALSKFLDMNQFHPCVQFVDTQLSYDYRQNAPYRCFKNPGSSKVGSLVLMNILSSLKLSARWFICLAPLPYLIAVNSVASSS